MIEILMLLAEYIEYLIEFLFYQFILYDLLAYNCLELFNIIKQYYFLEMWQSREKTEGSQH